MRVFPATRVEGGLFASDLFESILQQSAEGQQPKDFRITERNLVDHIAGVFEESLRLWREFRARVELLREKDSETTLTRERWALPFLNLLGFRLVYNREAVVVQNTSYPISHRVADPEVDVPVHVVAFGQDLGRVSSTGKRIAPHSLLQEYLNRTDALWGIVTNGRVLRLLRDSTYIRRQSYVEFDLEAIFEQRLFEDFQILFRLLHRTRFPSSAVPAEKCLLEIWYQNSAVQGARVRDRLRDGVSECLKLLANGFLAHPCNLSLREKVRQPGAEKKFYAELLRLIYRFLFLIVAEDRGLISQDPLYLRHYSVSRLRRLVDLRSARTDDVDLWHSFRVLWKLFSDDTSQPQLQGKPLASCLGLEVLNGHLFDPLEFFDSAVISNRDFLKAMWYLLYYKPTNDEEKKGPGRRRNAPDVPMRVNYAALDVEELGSVYESLLDYSPTIILEQGPRFVLSTGSERKSTGSYYTPAELVTELVRSALDPVIEDKLKEAKGSEENLSREKAEKALLSIRVCDPACGSGHFLLAAARRIAKELARIRQGEEEPSPEALREAVRDVISCCIYGVDKNPLAVELCRVALWIESFAPGKPLSYLDHRIRCGDSLVGVVNLDILESGIPDAAFDPIEGDDEKVAREWKQYNRKARNEILGNQTVMHFTHADDLEELQKAAREVDAVRDDSPANVRAKRKRFEELQQKAESLRFTCDLWTAAFFQRLSSELAQAGAIVTTLTLREYRETGRIHPGVEAEVRALAQKLQFFHWPVEFPEVFAPPAGENEGSGRRGGFDVLLANPPWEQLQLEEKEFFAQKDPEIANALNAAKRKQMIQELREADPALYEEYREAKRFADATSHFLRTAEEYPLTRTGKTNTYSVFAERIRALLAENGLAGIVVPSGIAMDKTNSNFFDDLVRSKSLVSFYDFENKGIFAAVHDSFRFSLLTFRGKSRPRKEPPRFAFFCHSVKDIHAPWRLLELTPEEIELVNPNTGTLPIFRTSVDARLTLDIYHRVPVLHKRLSTPKWNCQYRQMFNMTSDSQSFSTAEERLGARNATREGNVWRVTAGSDTPARYLPLYEAKMIWQYDHRFGTYENVRSWTDVSLPTPEENDYANPGYLPQPRYWVSENEVEGRLTSWSRPWLLGFRDIARSTDQRTVIATVIPRTAGGNSLPLLLVGDVKASVSICAFLGNLNSLVFDYLARQKVGGTHLNLFYLQQLPVLPPSTFDEESELFIVPRVLELVYTAWDLKPFADDLWKEASPLLRKALLEQWRKNREETGGNSFDLPSWAGAWPAITRPAPSYVESPDSTPVPEVCPFSPFRWNSARRANLQAELDAWYAKLYRLTRKQLRYILDPADLTEKELEDILDPSEEVSDPLDPEGYKKRVEASDFPGETFRALKTAEEKAYGEYRTRRLVLEAWERLIGKA
jgi:hypothetical protein